MLVNGAKLCWVYSLRPSSHLPDTAIEPKFLSSGKEVQAALGKGAIEEITGDSSNLVEALLKALGRI